MTTELEKLQPNGQEIADAIAFVVMELAAVLEPDPTLSDEKLEDLASRLATVGNLIQPTGVGALVRGVADVLMATEQAVTGGDPGDEA
jgi:hypothetical protein